MSAKIGNSYRVAPRQDGRKTVYVIERKKDGEWVAFGGIFTTFAKADAYLARLHKEA